MLAALLTAVFFAATVVFARRAAVGLGPTGANFARLLLAALLLGGWSLFFGHGFGSGSGWFFASGLAGFGIGGLLMFQALPRAGANLANLAVQCGSAVVALVAEWLWLGSPLGGAPLACIATILAGVVVGLAPRSFPQFAPGRLRVGAGLALCSAVGQGLGQVLSRRGFADMRAAGERADPGTVTFERVLAGLLVAGVALFLAWRMRRADCGMRIADCGLAEGGASPRRSDASADGGHFSIDNPQSAIRSSLPWVVLNTLTGPVLGVTCLQWALSQPQLHAGVTQSIVAAAPLLTAPLAWRLGEDIPRARFFAGALLAVAGTAALWWVR